MPETREQSCEARLPRHRDGRLADFAAFQTLAGVIDAHDLDRDDVKAAIGQLDIELDSSRWPDDRAEGARDQAYERASEYPLGVSSYRSFRVELSTGGPADWLEVVCSGDTPRYEPGGEPYEVERIVYHFADWFDHAEQELTGEDFDTALAFVSHVVPELVE